MKNVTKTSPLSALILMVLVAAMVLTLAACSSDEGAASPPAGKKTFTFEVVDLDGNTETFEITSSARYVGEALIAEGLIEGEDGPYGLYVKTVNGITVDYDTDGHYWSFYVNGEYGMSGVDQTEIVDGAAYAFKVE